MPDDVETPDPIATPEASAELTTNDAPAEAVEPAEAAGTN